jgi:hypothetical protein
MTTPAARNPHDPERIAGGSSGGSAVAGGGGHRTLRSAPTPTLGAVPGVALQA